MRGKKKPEGSGDRLGQSVLPGAPSVGPKRKPVAPHAQAFSRGEKGGQIPIRWKRRRDATLTAAHVAAQIRRTRGNETTNLSLCMVRGKHEP